VRRLLDGLYDATAALAAVCMVGLLVMVLLSHLKGRAQRALEIWALSAGVFLAGLFAFYSVRLAWVSRSINDISTSNDATPLWIPELAMAIGTSILAIALIDELVLGALKGAPRRALELWSLAAGTALGLLFAGYSVRLSWQSYHLHDISTGNDATPLWLPQLAMAIGTSILAIALIDELVLEIRGRRIKAATDEPAHVE
jgi:TRAP-type C4-dicarboxylate transport system permease small subunit